MSRTTKDGCVIRIMKFFALFLLILLLMHWLTGGQDEIVEGPPETFNTSSTQ